MSHSFKTFLAEYYKYVSFEDTVDHEEDPVTPVPKDETADRKKDLEAKHKYDKAVKGDSKENYHPQRFRHYMEINVAAN